MSNVFVDLMTYALQFLIMIVVNHWSKTTILIDYFVAEKFILSYFLRISFSLSCSRIVTGRTAQLSHQLTCSSQGWHVECWAREEKKKKNGIHWLLTICHCSRNTHTYVHDWCRTFENQLNFFSRIRHDLTKYDQINVSESEFDKW